jgi:hypothetical protein
MFFCHRSIRSHPLFARATNTSLFRDDGRKRDLDLVRALRVDIFERYCTGLIHERGHVR